MSSGEKYAIVGVITLLCLLALSSIRPHIAEPWDTILIWGVALVLLLARGLLPWRRGAPPASGPEGERGDRLPKAEDDPSARASH